MIDLFIAFGFFLLKVIVVVLGILVVVAVTKGGKERSKLKIKHLNKQYAQQDIHLYDAMEAKADLKAIKKKAKAKAKKAKAKGPITGARIFVLRFTGDMKANQVKQFRKEISAVLRIGHSKQDEVVVILESPGGSVPHYGLAASQLARVREKGFRLVVCVDRVAASGGYLMACHAHHLIAAPFSIIGSVGVVMQLPNLNRLLKEKQIDFEQLTSGQYKRTLSVFGKNTKEGRQKAQDDIERIHALFKSHIKANRPNIDIKKVATGEIWLGSDALSLGLIDAISTSDDYLLQCCEIADVYEISMKKKRHWMDQITKKMHHMMACYFPFRAHRDTVDNQFWCH